MAVTTLREILHHEATDETNMLMDIIDAVEDTEIEQQLVEILVRRGYARD